MHVAARIALPLFAGGIAGAVSQSVAPSKESTPGSIGAMGTAAASTGLGALWTAQGGALGIPGTGMLALGGFILGRELLAPRPAQVSHGYEDLPVPQLPEPTTTGTTTTSPSRPGTVEEEVETYGPDGEWLGTEHGTLEVP